MYKLKKVQEHNQRINLKKTKFRDLQKNKQKAKSLILIHKYKSHLS